MTVEKGGQFEHVEAVEPALPHPHFESVLRVIPEEETPRRKRGRYPEDPHYAAGAVIEEVFSLFPFVEKIEAPTSYHEGLGAIDRWIHFADGNQKARVGVQIAVAGTETAARRPSLLSYASSPEEWARNPLAVLRISNPMLLLNISRAVSIASENPRRRAVDFLSPEDRLEIFKLLFPSLRLTDAGTNFLGFYKDAVAKSPTPTSPHGATTKNSG